MAQGNTWFRRLVDQTDLPAEAVVGATVVEIADDRRVLIENHRAIVEYGDERICVRVRFGSIVICGKKLQLAQMTKGQLVITGQIESLCFQRRSRP